MKRLSILAAVALTATSAFAALDAKTEQLVRESLPVCADLKITSEPFTRKMPDGLTATVVTAASAHSSCAGQWLMVTTRGGGFYLGAPWFLDGQTGTLEEKLKNFGWERLQGNFTPVIDKERTADGLLRVTLTETTERGKLPMEGEVDPAGTVFFLGHFRRANSTTGESRMKAFEPYIASSPHKGADKPQVTIVEFSDFECPSCRMASGYVDPIIEKYGDKVQYVRYDLPLSGHPWSFAAAVAGRAIYRQKPAVFWDYKKQIYSNQDKLNVFTIDEFSRNFAQDHDLDMTKYDADVASDQLRSSILTGAGAAFSNEIRATPTYMVNGMFVDPGEEGKDLAAYVAKQLK